MNVNARNRRRRLAFRGLVVAAIAIAVGGAGVTEKGSAARNASAPQSGGTLKVAMTSDLQGLDPANTGQTQWLYDSAVYNTLIDYSQKGGHVLQPEPDLATTWTLAKNARSLTFHLRQGVTFQNGKPFTSADVAYAIERLRSTKVLAEAGNASQLEPYAAEITHLKTPNKYTVSMSFKDPQPSIFDFFDKLYIVDKNVVDGPSGNSQANGTGPFMLQSWTPGQGYTLVKNPHYFKKGLPYLDGVNVTIVASQQTRYLQFKAGQIDFAPNLDPATTATLTSDQSGQLAVGCPVNNYYIEANVKNAPLNNQDVREAINHTIDRVRFVQQILANQGTAIDQPWGPVSPAYSKTFKVTQLFDPGYAKALMAKSGLQTPVSVELDVNSNQPVLAQLAQIMQADLAPVGINLTVKTITAAQFQAASAAANYPGLIAGPYGNPCLSPTNVFASNALDPVGNNANFSSAAYTALVNTAETATTAAAQKKAFAAVSTYLIQQSFFMPIATQAQTFALGRDVHGFTSNSLNGTFPLEAVWLSQ